MDLTNKNVSIAVVGKDTPFTMYDDAGVDQFLAGIEGEERRGRYVWFCPHAFSLACYNMLFIFNTGTYVIRKL